MTNGWITLQHGVCKVTLYQGHLVQNMLNFRGGDVFAIARTLKERGLIMRSDGVYESDGSQGAVIDDPDGNVIYFNTSPKEAAG